MPEGGDFPSLVKLQCISICTTSIKTDYNFSYYLKCKAHFVVTGSAYLSTVETKYKTYVT